MENQATYPNQLNQNQSLSISIQNTVSNNHQLQEGHAIYQKEEDINYQENTQKISKKTYQASKIEQNNQQNMTQYHQKSNKQKQPQANQFLNSSTYNTLNELQKELIVKRKQYNLKHKANKSLEKLQFNNLHINVGNPMDNHQLLQKQSLLKVLLPKSSQKDLHIQDQVNPQAPDGDIADLYQTNQIGNKTQKFQNIGATKNQLTKSMDNRKYSQVSRNTYTDNNNTHIRTNTQDSKSSKNNLISNFDDGSQGNIYGTNESTNSKHQKQQSSNVQSKDNSYRYKTNNNYRDSSHNGSRVEHYAVSPGIVEEKKNNKSYKELMNLIEFNMNSLKQHDLFLKQRLQRKKDTILIIKCKIFNYEEHQQLKFIHQKVKQIFSVEVFFYLSNYHLI